MTQGELRRIEHGQHGGDLFKALSESFEVGEGREGTTADGLGLMTVDHVGKVADGSLAAALPERYVSLVVFKRKDV